MNIGYAAKLSGLSAKTIRYYEDIGLVVPRRQAANDYRDYTEDDVGQLTFLQRARAVGFGLDECRELLHLYRDPGRQSRQVKELVLGKLTQLDEQLQNLQIMRSTLAGMAARCEGNDASSCAIIDSLAEPVDNDAASHTAIDPAKDILRAPPRRSPSMSFTLVGNFPGETEE